MKLQLIPLMILVNLIGCSPTPSKPAESPSISEPYTVVAGSVGFDLTTAPPLPDGTQVWTATYTSKDGTSRFGIQLPPVRAGNEIGFGRGQLVAITGSQPAPLINALKIALKPKHMPSKVIHIQYLPFTLATLGSNQSRMKDGGFSEKPAGTWNPMKIFCLAIMMKTQKSTSI